MSNSLISHFPHELLTIICAHVYSAGLPSATPSLDPLYILPASAPTSQPTSYPPACWSEPVSRRTLANVALVNRAWSAAARPWLWRRLEVRLPRSWLALVDEIAGSVGVDGELDVEVAQREVDISIHEAAQAAVKARDRGCLDEEATRLMKEAILASLSGIPVELLSPPASREPSPRRLRSKSHSPARWQLIRTISDAMQDVMYRSEEPVYVPPIEDLRPGRYVQHIDFNHFRTIGMRRSVDEGVNSRFVTGDRLQAVLKETPNLVAFGATEYMDGALTLPVLKELFLRGDAARTPGHPTRGRGLVIEDLDDPEANDAARRRECRELEAVDLTGCVSGVMVNALADFVNTHLLRGPMSSHLSPDSGIATDGRNGRKRRARFEAEPLVFSSLKRLSLRGAKSIAPPVLSTFVLACPSLTHLDLSGTRVEPALLEYLGVSQSVQLESLALARCIRLTGESIRNLLIHAPATRSLRELNLYGDGTFPCPLSREEFQDVIEHAPCFTSGAMRYLDVSSAPLDGMLLGLMPAQPALRSLGLAYIPDLPLDAVARFLKDKAPQVEALVLLGTSPELGPRAPVRQISLMLHTKLITPLCLPPFSFSTTERRAPPTRLRVIELAPPLLTALGAGAGAWRIIKSKGGRGWYVDTASGWTAETNVGEEGLRRDLEKGHPWREAMERLADANGNVASGVGWHARKMEVLYGHGLLGREDGLYGAVSFAYQG